MNGGRSNSTTSGIARPSERDDRRHNLLGRVRYGFLETTCALRKPAKG